MDDRPVRAALETALANAVGSVPIEYENVVKFVRPTSGLWVRTYYMPNQPESAELGPTGRMRLDGTFQVSVFGPRGGGPAATGNLIATVLNAFQRGTVLVSGSVQVSIVSSGPAPAVPEDDCYHVPINIRWWTFIAK